MNYAVHLALLVFLSLSLPALAEDEGNHDHEPVAGPNGGRMIEAEPMHAEFLLNPDRTVTLTFYDNAMKPVAPAGPSVAVIAEAPGGKVKLELAPREGALRSTEPLPEGDGYRIVVQIRTEPGAKPQNFRFDLLTHTCEGCSRAEYACTCDHAS